MSYQDLIAQTVTTRKQHLTTFDYIFENIVIIHSLYIISII